MSRQGMIRRAAGWPARLALPLSVAIVTAIGTGRGRAQEGAPVVVARPAPTPSVAPLTPAGSVEVAAAVPVISPDVQVVRFHGPPGTRVEVLGPNPEPVPLGDNRGLVTVGLKVGVGYHLRLSNLPNHPNAELFPVIEVVGHLHRPAEMDPARFPVRVVFSEEDFNDVIDHNRLVTQIVYLEDPEQALPISLPKDEIPVVSLSPAEEPLKVASALGRVMAIVRLGGRKPLADELNDHGGPLLNWGAPSPCPFAGPANGRCPLPCGPVRGTAPPPGRPWLPRDEYLCDGGDHAEPVHFGGDGGLSGIDPRDAVIKFSDDRRPRVLPTNTVCVYAPRFAEVRVGVGLNEALTTSAPLSNKMVEHEASMAVKRHSQRLVQDQAAETNRHRARASGMAGRVYTGSHAEVRASSAYDVTTHIAGHILTQSPEQARNRQKASAFRDKEHHLGIKTAESAVVTGIIEGANQMKMSWSPRETVGVEVPPNKPGLAVIKRVSQGEAEAGDIVTFVIQYRNMGNTPIHSVAVIDSLLPRLGYVTGSAKGPPGTIFTAAENRVSSTELRWELPGAIAPGLEGSVSFQAIVR